jgi:hypothetical protein
VRYTANNFSVALIIDQNRFLAVQGLLSLTTFTNMEDYQHWGGAAVSYSVANIVLLKH